VKSIIGDLPGGSEVVFRAIRTLTVEIVYGHDDLFFSAVEPGRPRVDDGCEFYPKSMITDWDLPLVKRGAALWLVTETVRGRHGHMEGRSAIAFQHPGVDSAEAALATGGPDGGA
jgi:hypothetical protein